MIENKEVLGDRAELYVKNMAIELGIDAKSDRLTSIYKGAAKWLPAQVNRKMLTIAKTESAKKEIVPFAMLTRINSLGHFKKEKMIREFEANIETDIRNYSNYVREMNNILKRIADSTMRKKMLEEAEETNTLSSQVIQILENPFYQFLKLEEGAIHFTTSEVIMRWTKKSANLRYDVNLGSYCVVVNPQAGSANIIKHKNNTILEDTYIHPHIRVSGVCWGNASDAIKRIATEGDIRPAMTAIEALLQTYNDQSPYRSIDRFVEKQRENKFLNGKLGQFLIKPDQIREVSVINFNLKDLDLTVADLKYPIKYIHDQGRLAAPCFVCNRGLAYFELTDGSFTQIGRLTNGYHSVSEASSVAVVSFDRTIEELKLRSAIYKDKYSDLNISEIRALDSQQQTIFHNGTRSGLNVADIRKAAANVIR